MIRWSTLKFLFGILLFSKTSFGLFLDPSLNQWARIGSSAKLFCKASENISKCSWQTAYDTLYQLSSGEGSTAESGRLEYLSENEKECGLLIKNVTEKDMGTWFCHITTIKDNGVVAGKGQTTLALASRPASVNLVEPYNKGSVNVSLNTDGDKSAAKPISCRVSNASPKPTFSWYIGDTKLSSEKFQTQDVKEDDDNAWMQTLHYTPEVSHDNRTLRCVVEHVGLEESDNREASVTLRFTAQDKKIFQEEAIAEQDRAATIGAVTSVILVFGFCFSIVICYKKRFACFKILEQTSDHDEDSPMKEIVKPSEFTAVELTALDGETNGKPTDSENTTNEQNGTKCEEEKSVEKRNLSDRVASFFRFTRKDDSNENQGNVELGLNGSKCSTNGIVKNEEHDKKLEHSNGTKDNTDGTEEKKDTEKVDAEEDIPNETPIRFSKFLKLFKRNSQKTMEKMEETENEKEQNSSEGFLGENKVQEENHEREEQVEFEPETKPNENISTEKEMEGEEGNQSPKPSGSPKNTAV